VAQAVGQPDGHQDDLVVVGVDVGGTKVAMGAVTASGRVLARDAMPLRTTACELSPAQVAAAAGAFAAAHGLRPARLGLSVAAALDGRGTATFAPNLPTWQGALLAPPFAAALGLRPVALNDGHASLLGEVWLGAARGLSNVALLTIGTGVGGGILLDGQLACGRDCLAGVFAYLRVPWAGGETTLEEAVSGPALAGRLSQALGRDSTTEDVFRLAASGDSAAAAVLAEALAVLGGALSGIVSALNPERVLLAGNVGLALAAHAPALEAAVRRMGQPVAARGLEVRAAALAGDAAWLGAARAALDR
jgi:glucokinase